MLVHIVPTVPPAVNGLGDYCYKLWEHWPEPKPEWLCLAADVPAEQRESSGLRVSTFTLSRRGLLAALEEAKAETIVLHYVGHAYHAKGCPLWLPQALRTWKARRPATRLIVMFHELYFAPGRPWQTSFWLSPLSHKIMVDLANLANSWVTSSVPAQVKLSSEAKAKPDKGTLIPVGSNVPIAGNPVLIKLWPLCSGGRLKIVVFGLPATRAVALQKHATLLKQLLERSLVESITLVGKSSGNQNEEALVAGFGHEKLWRREYNLSPEGISDVLINQDVGLVATQPNLLTKSGVYAALCAHGIIPLVKEVLGANESIVPMFLVADTCTNDVIEHLSNEQEISDLKQNLRQTNNNFLSWRTIACQWTHVVGNTYDV